MLLVDCDRFERRHISQVGFLSRNQGENTCTVIYEDGEFLDSDIPQDIMDKFIKYGLLYTKRYKGAKTRHDNR